MAKQSKYDATLRNLQAKLARQEGLVAETKTHIAGIEELMEREQAELPLPPPTDIEKAKQKK